MLLQNPEDVLGDSADLHPGSTLAEAERRIFRLDFDRALAYLTKQIPPGALPRFVEAERGDADHLNRKE